MPKKIDLERRIAQLRQFWRSERRPPSYAEMLNLFDYRSKNSVHDVIRKLETEGYVERQPHNKLNFTSKLTSFVRILGTVEAGFPSPAEEELVDVVSLDEFLINNPESTFMLTVSGDSMIDAGIHPGDILLVERNRTPKPNDIVVAHVDNEWTLKYFGKDKKGIYLDPANRNYSRIRPMESLEIGGVIKAVIRKYR